jgi:hypothetical protein
VFFFYRCDGVARFQGGKKYQFPNNQSFNFSSNSNIVFFSKMIILMTYLWVNEQNYLFHFGKVARSGPNSEIHVFWRCGHSIVLATLICWTQKFARPTVFWAFVLYYYFKHLSLLAPFNICSLGNNKNYL